MWTIAFHWYLTDAPDRDATSPSKSIGWDRLDTSRNGTSGCNNGNYLINFTFSYANALDETDWTQPPPSHDSPNNRKPSEEYGHALISPWACLQTEAGS